MQLTRNTQRVQHRVHICSLDLVFLSRRGLEDEGGLDQKQDCGRIEQWVVGEEDDIVFQNGCPYQGGQDPDPCLSEDG